MPVYTDTPSSLGQTILDLRQQIHEYDAQIADSVAQLTAMNKHHDELIGKRSETRRNLLAIASEGISVF